MNQELTTITKVGEYIRLGYVAQKMPTSIASVSAVVSGHQIKTVKKIDPNLRNNIKYMENIWKKYV